MSTITESVETEFIRMGMRPPRFIAKIKTVTTSSGNPDVIRYRTVLGEYPTRELARIAGALALSISGADRLCTPEDIDLARKQRRAGK